MGSNNLPNQLEDSLENSQDPAPQPEHLKTAGRLDQFAVLLSGVCVLHCLIAPLVFTLIPIFSLNAFLEDLVFHQLMLWLVIPTSVVALSIGCRQHRDWKILACGAFGMLLLLMVALMGHDLLTPFQEKLTTSVAAIVLATSHILNYRACQQITCSDKDCRSKHHH